MKQRALVPLIAALTIFGGVAGPTRISAGSPQQKAAEHRFRVGKLSNKWRVYDSKNPQNRVIMAKRGDIVVWSATGSDIFVNFSDAAIFGTDEASTPDGKDLVLTVASNAKPGRYTYSVFCAKEGKFATGDSPPVIIIQ